MTDEAPAKRESLLRRLYNWVIHWAYTPYGQPALFVLSFIESSFFPIPPDVLMVPLCIGDPKKALRFAFWCSLASVLGGMFGYWLGATLWDSGLDRFCFDYIPGFTEAKFGKISDLYDEWNFWIVFIAGFSPLPYKVFTITAGVFAIDFPMFVLASAVSRSSRFYLEAILFRIYGARIRHFVENRLGLVSLVFCVVLVGGFVAVKYLL